MDLQNYETVKERKKKFYSQHPDGRIIVELQNSDIMDHALFKATIYKTGEDLKNCLPWSTGYALEIREKNLSVSKNGDEYASVNYTSWVENCEESSIGRSLDNAGFSGNNKCSREEMVAAQKHGATPGASNGSKLPKFEDIKEKLKSMAKDDMKAYFDELDKIGFASDKQKYAIQQIFNVAYKEKEGAA